MRTVHSLKTILSRRQFLERGATLVSAGVAAPLLIPATAFSAPGRPGPNDCIGIAGIGIGRQGSGVFLAAVKAKGGRAVAVADANIRRAAEMARKLKIDAFQDYRKVLDRKDVDAITTATPDHWRSLVCIHACQAEKDVYAEKPMTLTIREGRLMVDAVRRYKRVFQTGSQQRSDAKCRFGCELIRSGRIGKVRKVIAHNYPSPWECASRGSPFPTGSIGICGAARIRSCPITRIYARPVPGRVGSPSAPIPAAR